MGPTAPPINSLITAPLSPSAKKAKPSLMAPIPHGISPLLLRKPTHPRDSTSAWKPLALSLASSTSGPPTPTTASTKSPAGKQPLKLSSSTGNHVSTKTSIATTPSAAPSPMPTTTASLMALIHLPINPLTAATSSPVPTQMAIATTMNMIQIGCDYRSRQQQERDKSNTTCKTWKHLHL